jgi:2'-5' RNA ligase
MSSRSRSLRLFLALWPDEAVRARIADHAAAWSLPPGCLRYQPWDWHVTLHYIGPLAIGRAAALADAVDLPIEPFELQLDKPRLWPRGLAILESSQVPAALQDLHRRLAAALSRSDVPLEQRPYRPHVTLARGADGALVPPGRAPVRWPARSFALVVSTGSSDQRYEVLREYRSPAK